MPSSNEWQSGAGQPPTGPPPVAGHPSERVVARWHRRRWPRPGHRGRSGAGDQVPLTAPLPDVIDRAGPLRSSPRPPGYIDPADLVFPLPNDRAPDALDLVERGSRAPRAIRAATAHRASGTSPRPRVDALRRVPDGHRQGAGYRRRRFRPALVRRSPCRGAERRSRIRYPVIAAKLPLVAHRGQGRW